MKLIIQIPCYNEEKTLSIALADLPREVAGVDEVEWLVIDDGSRDRTVEVARENGVDHIVQHTGNQGLARAFMTGITACLERGADIIVNTDADNQYQAADIPKLVKPILEGEAEFVVGARPVDETEHWSRIKKSLQKLGSWAVRKVSRTEIPDAPSGFRAISRNAAFRLNVFNRHTYTLETIIQAGREGIPITSVPIRTNPELRESRLIKSIPSYIWRSGTTILKVFAYYQPFQFFFFLGLPPFLVGSGLFVRWLVLFLEDSTRTHVPSLVFASTMLFLGFLLWALGVLGESLSSNRQMMVEIQRKLRAVGFDSVAAKEKGPGKEKRFAEAENRPSEPAE